MSQRDDLLAAARKLLVEKGYHRTTARDLAAASGAHLASIGYHFGSKDALMSAAALEAQGAWGDTIDAAVRAADAANPTERLRICVDELIAAIAAEREVLVASVQAYAQAEYADDIRQVLSQGTERARGDLAAMVLGLAAENVGAETAHSLGSVVHSLIVGLSFQAFLDPDSLPSGEQVVSALRVLVSD